MSERTCSSCRHMGTANFKYLSTSHPRPKDWHRNVEAALEEWELPGMDV